MNAIEYDPFPGVWNGTTPPDYVKVLAWRQRRLVRYRKLPILVVGAKAYYKLNPADFIEHWCTTYDPRNAQQPGLMTHMPFVMFQRQREFIDFLYKGLYTQTNLLVEKCRDVGLTWLCCAASVHMWLFMDGSAIGWGSRKQELVDELGVIDSIIEKIRVIVRGLPVEFLPSSYDMPFMRVINRDNGSTITGEVGDNIGRGGRKLIFFKDESAHYERPDKIEAALGDNTNVQVDISSVNGIGNPFHNKRKAGVVYVPGAELIKYKTNVFIFDWRDHPLKTPEWHALRKEKWENDGLGYMFAQEVDRNYSASVVGTIIKLEWVQAAFDAHLKLGFPISGQHLGSLDVADETAEGDLNAAGVRKGICLIKADQWGGIDTGKTTRKTLDMMRHFGLINVQYDCIGVGAGVKAEINRIAEIEESNVSWTPWNAAGKVLFPEKRLLPLDRQSPKNEDYFQNIKSQGWWQLARRFERTWQMVNGKAEYDPDELISIVTADIPVHIQRQIEDELCQVVAKLSTATLKLIIDKSPNGTRSPNLADMIMMLYWPIVSRIAYDQTSIHG